MQIAHYSRLSVRRYTYPYTIFNGLSGKAVAKRPRARFSCCTMTTNLGETFREGGRFHSARLSCTNIHNPCPKVRKRSVLREHQRPRRAGEVEELYDTTDASNPWWKYPVTGDENETDQFGGTSAAYNRGALALAALRSTVGDAKFREIEKTWVQEHQEQFDPTGLKITATYSDKSTKAIDAAERRVQPAVQDRRQHGSDHSPGGTRTADGRRQRGPVWLFAAWLRRERSLWGNAVAVLATSMMTVVIASFGDRLPPLCGAGGGQVSCDAVAQYRQGIRALPDWRSWTDVQAWWPAYSAPKAALTAAIVFALTQYGSVLFAKTMIREYGKDPTWWPHGCGTRRLPSPGSPSICGWVSSRSSC